MSGWPRCASAAPSHSVIMLWTIDCGCTTTLMRAYPMPNRWKASITSRPLFMSVAESIEIFAAHVPGRVLERLLHRDVLEWRGRRPGTARRSLGRVSRRFPVALLPAVGQRGCAESTGRICAPVGSASAMAGTPPTTSHSLSASAGRCPRRASPRSGRAGRADERVEDEVGAGLEHESHEPLRPGQHLAVGHCSAARAPAWTSASAMRSTPNRRLFDQRVRRALRAEAHGSNSGSRATISSACVPIDPVQPRMRRRRGTRPSSARRAAPSLQQRDSGSRRRP